MKYKYSKQAYLGYDSNGKQIRKWFYADSKTELKQKIKNYKDEIKHLTNPTDMTFAEYSEHWFQTYKSIRSVQTQDACRTHLRKCSALDPYPIRKITRSMCQQAVNDVWDRPHTAKGVADVLRQIFRSAVSDGIVASNPAADLRRPKLQKAAFHLLTDKELDAIKRADLNEEDRFLVTILQVFGLRPAEALALCPTDFDLRNKMLHITKALELPNTGQSRIKSTKTGASRDIPIPEALIAPLRARLRGNSGLFLFEKATGGLHTKSSYKRLSERIWKAVNEVAINDRLKKLKKVTPAKETLIRSQDYFPEFTLYSFRHRRATDLYYLCQKGTISTKQAAALMGHSEIIFLKTYSHIDDSKENLTQIYADLKVENL